MAARLVMLSTSRPGDPDGARVGQQNGTATQWLVGTTALFYLLLFTMVGLGGFLG